MPPEKGPPAGPVARPAARRALPDGIRLDFLTVVATVGTAVLARHLTEIGNEDVPWYVQLVIALPLFTRRRWPAEAFAVTAAAAVAQYALSGVPAGELTLLVALYAVGAYERRRWALVVSGAGALLGGSAAVLAWSPSETPGEIVVLLAGTVTAAWVSGVYVRTRRAYVLSVLDRAATAERERDQQARTVRAEERIRLSREIHDIVAHNLSVMIALGDGAAIAMDRDPDAARAAIGQSSATGRQALDEIRRLLGAMRDPDDLRTGPQPGLADIEDLVARVRTADLRVETVVSGRPRALPAGAELAVFRIVQEGLTNVLKHAPLATGARVELSFDNDDVRIVISNDGAGPAGQAPHGAHPGHGLTGMRERAAVFAGAVEAGPVPPRDWRVEARMIMPSPAGPLS